MEYVVPERAYTLDRNKPNISATIAARKCVAMAIVTHNSLATLPIDK